MGNLSTTVRRSRYWGVFVAVALLVSLLAVRADADPIDDLLGNPGTTYPNLVPDVEDVQVQTFRFTEQGYEEGSFLWFDTQAQNHGTVPVQLTVDKVETPETSTVSQCTSWRSAENHICRETEVVGGFTWHDAHGHFHYVDFARYQLRSLADSGRPDYSPTGLLRTSEKVSFCLIDSEQIRSDARATPFYAGCPPVVQGVSPGWTDIYTSDLEGQNFRMGDLPNGEYALIVDMDYANTLRETDNDDNYVEVTIRISDTDDPSIPSGRKVEILRRHRPGPDDRGTTTTSSTSTKKPKKPKKNDNGR